MLEFLPLYHLQRVCRVRPGVLVETMRGGLKVKGPGWKKAEFRPFHTPIIAITTKFEYYISSGDEDYDSDGYESAGWSSSWEADVVYYLCADGREYSQIEFSCHRLSPTLVTTELDLSCYYAQRKYCLPPARQARN